MADARAVQAITYREANVTAAVTVDNIAAARLSVPALPAGLRAHLATTFLAHLRRLRLDRVHHTLLALWR